MTAQEAIARAEELWEDAHRIHREKEFPGQIQPHLAELREIEDALDPEVDEETLDKIEPYRIDMKRWAR